MEGKRRLGALVCVYVVCSQPVAAAAGGEVIERPAEAVSAQEPLEGALRTSAMVDVSRHRERRQFGLDKRRRIEWLLVTQARGGLGAVTSLVAGKPQSAVREATLVTEPGKRGEPDL